MRFKVQNEILFLQIETAELGPMVTVNKNSVQWDELPTKIPNKLLHVFKPGTCKFMASDNWFTTSYLTGVKLKYTNSGGIRIDLVGKIVTAQSLGYGVLDGPKDYDHETYVVDNYDTIKVEEKKLGLGNSGNLTYPDYKVNKSYYIEFWRKDNGFPYFDTTSVSYEIKAPIMGIGFFHYTNSDEYAGFIRPYLIPFHYPLIFQNINKVQERIGVIQRSATIPEEQGEDIL